MIKVCMYPDREICVIRMSRADAIELIESLAHQLVVNHPNNGRLESSCEGDAKLFTIAVIPDGGII